MSKGIKRIKYKIMELYYASKEADRIQDIVTMPEYEKSRMEATIVRFVHSLEKGLSIETPRPFFGQEKIQTMINLLLDYTNKYGTTDMCVSMACDSFSQWIKWHEDKGYNSQEFADIVAKINNMIESVGYKSVHTCRAGVQTVFLNDMTFNKEDIYHFFNTRHSIRQFTGEPVGEDVIRASIQLAQTAPSACNRQGVRVYSIDSRKYVKDMETDLTGIGGFTDNVDKFLLITGKLSAYDEYEHNQYVVSAGIFAGYLSLALHAHNVGACVIQRSMQSTAAWEKFQRKNNIPQDEQIVCMVGIGCMKNATVVPISKRYDLDTIYKKL